MNYVDRHVLLLRFSIPSFWEPGISVVYPTRDFWGFAYVIVLTNTLERSIIYLPKQERKQWADWNKSVHVGTCVEVSHMQPQLSAILSEWQHVKWACVWALSRRAAASWQRASAHVCRISGCHSAMWVPTAKSPTLQSMCELSACVLLLHDNAPVHMSAKSQAAIQQCGFQQLNHPPSSPDLAPSDYFLFRVM